MNSFLGKDHENDLFGVKYQQYHPHHGQQQAQDQVCGQQQAQDQVCHRPLAGWPGGSVAAK